MNDKQLVAVHAANLVEDGMVVGLGTGSTANYFIEALSVRQREQGLRLSTVSSSAISAIKAVSCGLQVLSIAQLSHIDLYVDGADEVSPRRNLLKGRGQDLVMEKLLARAATRFVVVADNSKLVEHIGDKFVIPIEVIPAAWQLVKHRLQQVGASGDIRLNAGQDNVAVSAHGSYVLDMKFGRELDEQQLNALLNDTPGIVEHGLFHQLAHTVLIADNGQVSEL